MVPKQWFLFGITPRNMFCLSFECAHISQTKHAHTALHSLPIHLFFAFEGCVVAPAPVSWALLWDWAVRMLRSETAQRMEPFVWAAFMCKCKWSRVTFLWPSVPYHPYLAFPNSLGANAVLTWKNSHRSSWGFLPLPQSSVYCFCLLFL